MTGVHEEIARRYRHFGDVEARGRSPLYVAVAHRIAGDGDVLAWLAGLPAPKRQPNLLFGAVRYLYGTPDDDRAFVACIHGHADELSALMLRRSTQTNEPARCATLLPVLAALPQPLALLEVGASAGLCLIPDRYGYDYGRRRIGPSAVDVCEAPVLACEANAATPLPRANVEVAWRAGLDLDPVDLDDPEGVRWLQALVWPGEEHRLEGLAAACEVARRDRVEVVRGDLLCDLPALAARAPRDATLVVFHTAVLGYVADPEDRAAFAATVAQVGATWVANEPAELIPGIDPATLGDRPDADAFLLAVDGTPTAWTDGHGTWVRWRR